MIHYDDNARIFHVLSLCLEILEFRELGDMTLGRSCFHVSQSMIGDILAEADPVSQTRRFGAVVLEGGKIPRSKEEKTKQDLTSIISRWNALSKEVFNTSHRLLFSLYLFVFQSCWFRYRLRRSLMVVAICFF